MPWEWKWTYLFFSFRSFLVREQPFSFIFFKSFKNIDFVRSLNFCSFSIHFCQIRSFSQKTIVFKSLFKQRFRNRSWKIKNERIVRFFVHLKKCNYFYFFKRSKLSIVYFLIDSHLFLEPNLMKSKRKLNYVV